MRWSKCFIPTLREFPADAETPAHGLLIRAGMIRAMAQGIYSLLPLGRRIELKIVQIMREEMNRAGAQEFALPTFRLPEKNLGALTEMPGGAGQEPAISRHPGEATGIARRGATQAAAFLALARNEVRSYKELPQIWFRIQAGLHRGTEMDSLSLDPNEEGLEGSYETQRDACSRILRRCGVDFFIAQTTSGTPDRLPAEAYMVPGEGGEEPVAICRCGYAASLDCAAARTSAIEDVPSAGEPREVATPGQKTIADIAAFLNVPPANQIKSLVYAAGGRLHLLLVRGDHQLSEAKAAAALESEEARQATPEEIRESFGADAGSLGPAGVRTLPIWADHALRGRRNLTCGANKNDFHLQGVTPDKHFHPQWVDLRAVEAGDICVRCGQTLTLGKASPVAGIRRLGARFSKAMGATVLTADGRPAPIASGSCSISVERIMSAVVDLSHDADGIIWPAEVAPFTVVITPIRFKDAVKDAAEKLHAALLESGVDALLDDREERPGVKFKDADLIGIPFRIVLGPEKVGQGRAELFNRRTRQTEVVELEDAAGTVRRSILSDGKQAGDACP